MIVSCYKPHLLLHVVFLIIAGPQVPMLKTFFYSFSWVNFSSSVSFPCNVLGRFGF